MKERGGGWLLESTINTDTHSPHGNSHTSGTEPEDHQHWQQSETPAAPPGTGGKVGGWRCEGESKGRGGKG